MRELGYEKPVVQLSGTDGNVFALLGKCTGALRKIGHKEMARRLAERVLASGSYTEALAIMGEYVETV
jgi:hypothetical protein